MNLCKNGQVYLMVKPLKGGALMVKKHFLKKAGQLKMEHFMFRVPEKEKPVDLVIL